MGQPRETPATRVYVFADESGNFDFSREAGASKYFLVGTVTMLDLTLEQRLLDLRRELAWRKLPISSGFHASEDRQAVRDAVFGALQGANFRYDVTVLEKCRTVPHLRDDDARFLKTAWFLHFQYVAPKIAAPDDELFVIAAAIGGNKKAQSGIRAGIEDVVQQPTVCSNWGVGSWPASSDPGLQAVDYCTWAVARKWERDDERSYRLIANKINTEFPVFANGEVWY